MSLFKNYKYDITVEQTDSTKLVLGFTVAGFFFKKTKIQNAETYFCEATVNK